MYTRTVIETADELVRCAHPAREEGSEDPYVTIDIEVMRPDQDPEVVDIRVSVDNPNVELSDKITGTDVIRAVFKNSGVDANFQWNA